MKQLIDKFTDYAVSTVYAPDVEKYETMILYPNKNDLFNTTYVLALRYETEEEARKGHLEVIQNLQRGMKYSGKDEIIDEIVNNCDIPKMFKLMSKLKTPKV